jgi:hypothetical protein
MGLQSCACDDMQERPSEVLHSSGTKEEQHNRITGTYAPWLSCFSWRASFVRRQGSHDPALFPFWLWSTSYD